VSPLAWIVLGGLLMSGIALLGAVTFFLSSRVQQKLILPLVAFSAGSLLGSAFFHMLPTAGRAHPSGLGVWIWVLLGFSLFFAFEQLLHWHRCQHAQGGDPASTLPTLIIAGDALHNLLGGMAVAGAFLVDAKLGVATWLAEAAHELPQELGEYGVLLHGGWSRRKALIVNVLSSLPFLAGGLLTWAISLQIDVAFLVPFAAGNFLYIAASDLIPEVNRHHRLATAALHFAAFAAGVLVLLAIRIGLEVQ
jgi:zinc and cadmium transporter